MNKQCVFFKQQNFTETPHQAAACAISILALQTVCVPGV